MTETRKHIDFKEEEEDDDENKTVNNDTFSVSDTLKSSFVEAHNIFEMPSLKAHPDKYNVFQNNFALYTKLNKLIDKVQNKTEGTSDFRTLRTLKRELHFGEKLTFVHAPKKSILKHYNE